jgi:hypothetical protein
MPPDVVPLEVVATMEATMRLCNMMVVSPVNGVDARAAGGRLDVIGVDFLHWAEDAELGVVVYEMLDGGVIVTIHARNVRSAPMAVSGSASRTSVHGLADMCLKSCGDGLTVIVAET